MKDSKISWTHHTFNPWMGCCKVSPGCLNCYAERLTRDRMGIQVWGKSAPRRRTKAPWRDVRKWNEEAGSSGNRKRVFCGSLCDVFEDHPTCNEIRPEVFAIIRECQNLDFLLLTKRPENIINMLPSDWGRGYTNVWLGTSIEEQRYAARARALCKAPAIVRFVSYEPALGPLQLDLTGIDWVIYGGESGPRHRQEDKQWARDMYAQCRAAGVAFYHKQSAGYKTELGIELDGKVIHQFPRTYRRG